MKNIYFIDYENVGPSGLYGIDNLTSSDEVYFFHYTGAGDIKYNNLHSMAMSKARTQVIKLSTHNKNAMDFQIVAMLGLLVGKYEERAHYRIISNDKGYLSAVECLKNTLSQKLKIETQPTIAGIREDSSIEVIIKNTLDGLCSPKMINRAVGAFKSAKSLQELHESLQKSITKDFDSIYKSIKPLYKQFRQEAA